MNEWNRPVGPPTANMQVPAQSNLKHGASPNETFQNTPMMMNNSSMGQPINQVGEDNMQQMNYQKNIGNNYRLMSGQNYHPSQGCDTGMMNKSELKLSQ